jgi:hypothetical protein
VTGNGSLSRFNPSEINPFFYYFSSLFLQDNPKVIGLLTGTPSLFKKMGCVFIIECSVVRRATAKRKFENLP